VRRPGTSYINELGTNGALFKTSVLVIISRFLSCDHGRIAKIKETKRQSPLENKASSKDHETLDRNVKTEYNKGVLLQLRSWNCVTGQYTVYINSKLI